VRPLTIPEATRAAIVCTPGTTGRRLSSVAGKETRVEPYAEITPEALRARLDTGPAPALLDVREPWEHALGALPGARLIPLDELAERVGEVEPGREVVVYCHHGVRSAAAVEWLRRVGLPAVNLAGGIDAWAARVDPALRRY
jgi:adenylyltransferase/sulfurtransferase